LAAVKLLIYYESLKLSLNSTHFTFQLKNAESILEYERMAEIGFEKRDFRMVSCTVVDILF